MTLADMANAKKYCGAPCRMAARRKRAPGPVVFCGCCGDTWPGRRFSATLALCVKCHYVAFKSCWRKIRYVDQDAAQRRAETHDVVPRTYPCPVCEGWHLTSGVELAGPGLAVIVVALGATVAGAGYVRQHRAIPAEHRVEESDD